MNAMIITHPDADGAGVSDPTAAEIAAEIQVHVRNPNDPADGRRSAQRQKVF